MFLVFGKCPFLLCPLNVITPERFLNFSYCTHYLSKFVINAAITLKIQSADRIFVCFFGR